MLTNGKNLGLLVHGTAGEEHYDALMAQWRGLDALIQGSVMDKDLTAPPAAPANGDTYIVAAGATGAWAGKDNQVARWTTDLALAAWEFFAPKAGWVLYVADEKFEYRYSGAAWTARLQTIAVACSDEATAITAGNGKVSFHMPFDFNLKEVFAGLSTPQASGNIFTVDVKEAGVSIFSTKPTIDNTEDSSLAATTQAVLSNTFLARGSKITVDVSQIGDGTAKGLKVYLSGAKA